MLNRNCERVKCSLLLILAIAAVFAMTGCQQPAPPPPDTRAADEAAIRTAEADLAQAAAAMDPAKMVSFYADDAVTMSDGSPLVQGKENVRKGFEEWMATKPEVSWKPVKVEVARSGDIAYSWGTGEVTAKDAKGKSVKSTNKYVSVWKKQTDGSWKLAVDTMISDPPAKKK